MRLYAVMFIVGRNKLYTLTMTTSTPQCRCAMVALYISTPNLINTTLQIHYINYTLERIIDERYLLQVYSQAINVTCVVWRTNKVLNIYPLWGGLLSRGTRFKEINYYVYVTQYIDTYMYIILD